MGDENINHPWVGLNPQESDFVREVKRAVLQRAMYYGTRTCLETIKVINALGNAKAIPPEEERHLIELQADAWHAWLAVMHDKGH